MSPPLELETRWIQSLRYPGPFWQLMYALPVLSVVAIEYGVFVFGQHFCFCWHLCLPSLQLLERAY